MIRLKCINDNCAFTYSVSEEEFKEYGKHYHQFCMICGSKLQVDNLEEIIVKDTEEKVKEYIDLWFRTLGIEYTIEMVERHKELAVYRLYKAEIEKRGFKIK
jgi:hypothetical protein